MLKGKRVSLRSGGRGEGGRGLLVCVVCAVVRLCAYLCVFLQGAKEAVQGEAGIDSCAVVDSERVRAVMDGIGVLRTEVCQCRSSRGGRSERSLSERSQSVSASWVKGYIVNRCKEMIVKWLLRQDGCGWLNELAIEGGLASCGGDMKRSGVVQ